MLFMFVWDRSGSMEGEKIENLRKGLWTLLEGTENIPHLYTAGILFDDEVVLVLDWDRTLDRVLKNEILGEAYARGSTNDHLALEKAVEVALRFRQEKGRDAEIGILVTTDGCGNESDHKTGENPLLAKQIGYLTGPDIRASILALSVGAGVENVSVYPRFAHQPDARGLPILLGPWFDYEILG